MPHILVIDDEAGIRHIIKLALAKFGVSVSEASNGETGLASALAGDPDVIIVDLRLPDIPGHQVADLYRHQGGQAPIILLSASGELEQMARHPAITTSLAKPFKLAQLWKTVESVLPPSAHEEYAP